MDSGYHPTAKMPQVLLLVKPKGVENSHRGCRWMDWTSGRPQRTHTWAILAACLGMLPLWGLLNSSGYFLCGDSRYRWHSRHASAEVSAIQVVLDTCGFWCWPRQFEWWNQLVELPVPQKNWHRASEDQLPFFIRPLLDGFCLCVGGRFWCEVWSLSDPGCVLDTECSKMSKLLISYLWTCTFTIYSSYTVHIYIVSGPVETLSTFNPSHTLSLLYLVGMFCFIGKIRFQPTESKTHT